MADEAEVAPVTETPPVDDAGTTAPGATLDTEKSETEKLREQLQAAERRVNDFHALTTKAQQDAAVAKAERDLLKSQADRGIGPQEAAQEQAAFDAEWEARLENNPKDGVKFFRGASRELAAELRRETQAELEKLRSELRETRETLNPDYQQNRDAVDKIVEKHGVSRAAAMAIVKDLTPPAPARPDRAAIPGRTVGGRGAREEPVTERIEAPAGFGDVMNLLNLDGKAQDRILTQKKDG